MRELVEELIGTRAPKIAQRDRAIDDLREGNAEERVRAGGSENDGEHGERRRRTLGERVRAGPQEVEVGLAAVQATEDQRGAAVGQTAHRIHGDPFDVRLGNEA